jgi:thiamine-monophosphate kinase
MAGETGAPATPPGEFELIDRFFAPIAAPGGLSLQDDAAFLAVPEGCELVVTKDMLIADVHFFASDPPGSIARKALGVNMSDLASKGATPLGFLLGLGRHRALGSEWLAAFATGLAAAAAEWNCPLYGGDTVNAPVLMLSITAFGSVPAGTMVRRQGGRSGDLVYVTGTIGDAALGLQVALQPEAEWVRAIGATHRAHLIDRYRHPRPRLALAPLLQRHARAAMDISDGLVGDADKLAKALGARCEILRVPLSEAARGAIAIEPTLRDVALTGGDDYEILAAIPPEKACAFVAEARAIGIDVTKIGQLEEAGSRKIWLDGDGSIRDFPRRSYTHNV